MDSRFNDLFEQPDAQIHKVVFFPDRIYHHRYLNATRSPRYRYDVDEVRSKADIVVLKGTVYMDEVPLSPFVRIEYRAARLTEAAREQNRFLRGRVRARLSLRHRDGRSWNASVTLRYCRWVDAYQVELWSQLAPPANDTHDYQILDLMGADGEITRVEAVDPALAELSQIQQVEVTFLENERDLPSGYRINSPVEDNNYLRSHEEPRDDRPNGNNTVQDHSYLLDFRRGWYFKASDVQPVRYENPLMETTNPDRQPGNIVEMRWLLQRELGGDLVFFHEVTVPPGRVEGTHQHIGSEELYYIVEGEGLGYLGVNDSPELAAFPIVERDIFGLGVRQCREVPLEAGHVIYTKSGGIHGIRNPGNQPLKFVAFLYQSS